MWAHRPACAHTRTSTHGHTPSAESVRADDFNTLGFNYCSSTWRITHYSGAEQQLRDQIRLNCCVLQSSYLQGSWRTKAIVQIQEPKQCRLERKKKAQSKKLEFCFIWHTLWGLQAQDSSEWLFQRGKGKACKGFCNKTQVVGTAKECC